MMHFRLYITILLLFLSAAICFSLDSLKVGDPAPRFVLKNLEGNTIFLSDFCGNLRNKADEPHVVVLSFFATWCAPCMSEIPILEKFNKDFQVERIKVFLVDVGEEEHKITEYVMKMRIDLPVLVDNFLTTSKHYGVVNQQGQMKIPQLVIIDKHGLIAYKQTGFKEDDDLRRMLIRKIGELLN